LVLSSKNQAGITIWSNIKLKITFKIQKNRENDGIDTQYLFREDSIEIQYQRRLEATLENQHAEIPAELLNQRTIGTLKTASNAALGVLDPRKRYPTEGWATTLENHKTAKQEAHQKWLHTKSAENKNTNEMWERKCAEINAYSGETQSSEAWKLIKTLRLDNKYSDKQSKETQRLL